MKMCRCYNPPVVWPKLKIIKDVIEDDVNIQIKLRRHLINCELVGWLYPSMMVSEIENLFGRFKNARSI